MRGPAEFTRLLFVWLNQVESDAELPASAFKIAYRISQHFDKNILSGYPGSEYIAGKTKLSKGTVLNMVRQLETHGHIAINPGRPGRGHSHLYRMIIKGQPADLLSAEGKGQPTDHSEVQKRSVFESEKVKFAEKKGQPADMNHLREPLKRTTISATKVAVREIEQAFENWWEIYPRKVEKKGAKAKYTAIVKRSEATIAELLTGANAYAAECLGKDPRYIKHPKTWLNNGCWADERVTVAKPNGPTPPDDNFWRERMKRYVATGDWAIPGPEPGQSGCRVPAHILAEFNISLH